MRILKSRMAAALFVFGVLVLAATITTGVKAQTPTLDPAATQILQKVTDYLDNLNQFSVHTQNTLEDVLDSGHRVDFDVSASVIVSRPNKLRAERRGAIIGSTMGAASEATAMSQQQATTAQPQAAAPPPAAPPPPAQAAGGKAIAAGHRCLGPPGRLHLHTGRWRGVLLLRRQLLSCGVSGEQTGVCDGPAKMKGGKS